MTCWFEIQCIDKNLLFGNLIKTKFRAQILSSPPCSDSYFTSIILILIRYFAPWGVEVSKKIKKPSKPEKKPKKPNREKKPIKPNTILKKSTGSARFRFYKPKTEKTEPKPKKTKKNRGKPKNQAKPEKTEPNRFEPVFILKNRTERKPVGLNRFRFGFGFLFKFWYYN